MLAVPGFSRRLKRSCLATHHAWKGRRRHRRLQLARAGHSRTIVPIVQETFVVERRLMLKEELRIRRVQTTESYQQGNRLPTTSRWAAARPNREDT